MPLAARHTLKGPVLLGARAPVSGRVHFKAPARDSTLRPLSVPRLRHEGPDLLVVACRPVTMTRRFGREAERHRMGRIGTGRREEA